MFEGLKKLSERIADRWKAEVIDAIFTEDTCKDLVLKVLNELDEMADKTPTGIDDFILGMLKHLVNSYWDWVWTAFFKNTQAEEFPGKMVEMAQSVSNIRVR